MRRWSFITAAGALLLALTLLNLHVPVNGQEPHLIRNEGLEYPEQTRVDLSMVYDVDIFGGSADTLIVYRSLPCDISITDNSKEKVLQHVTSVSVSPGIPEELPDQNDVKNQFFKWEFRDQKDDLHLTCNISITSNVHEWKMDKDDVDTIDNMPLSYRNRYLGDQWPVLMEENPRIISPVTGETGSYRYHPGDPDISALSLEIIGKETNVLSAVEMIYSWMVDNIRISTDQERSGNLENFGPYPRSPGVTLEYGHGSSVDMSLLMASILRAAGIPAWMVFGTAYNVAKDRVEEGGWLQVPIPMKDGGPEIVEIALMDHELFFHSPYRYTFWTDTGEIMERDGEQVHNLKFYIEHHTFKKSPFVQIQVTPSVEVTGYHESGSYIVGGSSGDSFPFVYVALTAVSVIVVGIVTILLLVYLMKRKERQAEK
ncbi:MAG: transglutaminase-like domain-containing protein [Candidatus Thermoplasmatota archaeon]|nr:transglutaminase-like domain-containing protein [Candidatus Thermoplasmatota archaeon]